MASVVKVGGPLNAREWVELIAISGDGYARFASELMDALDAADDVYAVADEFGELPPYVSLQDEARRLRTFEQRVLTMLVDWGAVDPADPSPPDAIGVLRMLLG